jgi:hypothetical protein
LDFLNFEKAINIIKSGNHLTKDGLNELIKLSSSMNSFRKHSIDYSPIHTLETSPTYIPLNGHYVNGFIAGDGCLYLNLNNKNFGRMALQISQHTNNRLLLVSIANYFNNPLKVYVHGPNSLQITLGGMKI